MTTVTFQDETAGGEPRTALEVGGLPDRMTARDLLHLRVREEVTRHNADPTATPSTGPRKPPVRNTPSCRTPSSS